MEQLQIKKPLDGNICSKRADKKLKDEINLTRLMLHVCSKDMI